jgi:large subunit ribosomal protein L18
MAIKSKKVRITARERVKIRIRKKVFGEASRPRLSVFRSSKHMYAQLVDDISGKTLASASTLEKEVCERIASVDVSEAASKAKSVKSVAAAHAVGLVLAERSKEHKVTRVVFDRNGFVYHGRVKAVAEGARAGGLEF